MTRSLPSAPRQGQRSAARDDCTPLFRLWQRDGDRQAREQLVERFLPLARSLALRYVSAHEPLEDLLQVANLALVKAIDRFDPDRGLAFTSFAVPTILGELRRYFRDFGWSMHVPRGAQERALRVDLATRELTSETGRPPRVERLAEHLGWDQATVLDALEAGAARHAKSLDTPARDDEPDSGSIVDTLGAEDHRLELVDDRLSVAGVLRTLPLIERRVVRMRFIDDLTQSQIGERIGCSQMQVSRILRSALDRVRETIETPALEPVAP